MAKVEITRTELVWPGKYNEDGTLKEVPRASLPMRTVERTSGATEQISLFSDSAPEGWRNRLILGDNLLVMGSLLDEFAGKIDLIYIDPPFATGSDFTFATPVGESTDGRYSVISDRAYSDTWCGGIDAWFNMIVPRLRMMRELLSDSGTIYVHLDWHVGHHMRPVLDEIFGSENSLGEIIWAYGSPSGGRASARRLVKAHDLVLIFAKRYGQHKYRQFYLPYSEQYINTWFCHFDEDGRRYHKRPRRDKNTGERYFERQYLDESKGVPASTVWSDIVQLYARPYMYKIGTSTEYTGFSTQKPEELIRRILEISSEPGDLVADFFCGSGTTPAVAEKLGRRWIACDMSNLSIHVTRKRLLDIKGCSPFDVMHVGEQESGGDREIRFDAEVHRPAPLTVQIELTSFFSPPVDRLVTDGDRLKWSDYIDYWAVDWDSDGETLTHGWVAYRTRKERRLPLVSEPHAYERPGEYRVLIEVVDVLGNETTRTLNISVL